MNFRTTTILFGTLMAMLLLFGIIVEYRQSAIEKGFLFPSLQADTITEFETIEFARDGEKYLFIKTADQGWSLANADRPKDTLRVKDSDVETLLSEIRQMRKNEQADVPRDKASAGLDDPTVSITLKPKESSKEWTVKVGGKSGDGANVFVATSDLPGKINVVAADTISKVLTENVNSFRERSLLSANTDEINYVSITRPGKDEKKLILQRDKEGIWHFVEPNLGMATFLGDAKMPDETGVKGLLDTITGLQAESVKDFVALGSRTLNDLGVETGTTMRINIKKASTQDKIQTIYIGTKSDDDYYARLASDPYAVLVRAKKVASIEDTVNNPRALRSKDLSITPQELVEAIRIRTGKDLSQEIVLDKEAPTLWNLLANGQTYKADQPALSGKDGLLAKLEGKNQISKFFDPDAKENAEALDKKLGLNTPTAEVSLYTEAPKDAAKPDFAKMKPATTLTFGKVVDNHVYVKRVTDSGFVSRLQVPSNILTSIAPPQGYIAFLDTSLPSIDVSRVEKIQLQRGSETLVLAKQDNAKNPWKIEEPKSSGVRGASTQQVNAVLQKLNSLEVLGWVQRIGEKDDLEKAYQLAKPNVTVTLTFANPAAKKDEKDKDKKEPAADTKTYKFGKVGSIGETKGVYALVTGTDLVFLTSQDAVDFFETVELRDSTIFDFAAQNIRQVQIHGDSWTRKAKFKVTLDVKREGATTPWTVERPDGYALNSGRLNTFLDALSHLQTQKYIALQGGIQPSQKPSGGKAELEVSIKLVDEKKDIVLTIWKETPDNNGYYAEASTMPGVVFVLSKSEFEPVLSSIGFFSAGE